MSETGSVALHQYLTFTLGSELFALDIGWVKEILDDKNITKIPRTPDFVRGVINVRGRAIPVVDLRLKFGMPATELATNTCVIIAEVEMQGEKVVMGALADAVQEVLELRPDDIEPAPRLGSAIDVEFIQAIGKHNSKFIIILDINKVFSPDELADVNEVGGGQQRDQLQAAA